MVNGFQRMLDHNQLRELIIKPTLISLQLYSESAVELLVFTCAAESKGGTYIKQLKGPALGIFQIEPATYNDLWQNYIKHRPDLTLIMSLNFNANFMPDEERMIYDLRYSCAMARIFYRRVPEVLPAADDIDGMWAYYKRYYNTHLGKATKQHAVAAYHRFIR